MIFMETLFLKNDAYGVKKAAEILKSGGLVAIPTETVYGLAADALSGEAVKKIFQAKGRPADNPLIVHVADVADIERLSLVKEFPEKARKLAEKFWPGPLTIIMKKGDVIPDEVSAGLDTVAVRLPSHKTARALIEKSGCALAAPSANSSGRPSPTTAAHVMDDMDGKIDAVLDGGACAVGVESTVVTVVTNPPRILRPGLVTKEEIESVIGETEVDRAVLGRLESGEKASSPGMKYKHYSPKARVVLVRASDAAYRNFINRTFEKDKTTAALCYDEDMAHLAAPCVSLGGGNDEESQAKALFDALRKLDAIPGVKTAFARCPKTDGVGMALFNRLIRAAAFDVIDIPTCRLIGLSGQTGAGKGEVSKILSENGFKVIDCDAVAHEALLDDEMKKELVAAFGDVLNADGTPDRKKLSKIAFSSDENRRKLNAVTHPKIVDLMLRKAEMIADSPDDIIVFDAPTLFEAGADVFCEKIVAVLADENIRLERVMKRDNITEKAALMRMNTQHDDAFFISHSDFVIFNNGSVGDLASKTLKVVEELRV